MSDQKETKRLLLIEPFYGGSHRRLIDIIHAAYPTSHLLTLPATKWHWRARTAALTLFTQVQALQDKFDVLFCSSTLNLAELQGLCPFLATVRKIIYFHENQLIYPVRQQKQRDYQYGYNQILSCLVADEIWFNSDFNRRSFLDGISPFLNIVPPPKIPNCTGQISEKCRTVYYPVELPLEMEGITKTGNLHILWPHRWEHDKNPEDFFQVLFDLSDEGCRFRLHILGERTTDISAIFEEAKTRLSEHIDNYGFLSDVKEYYKIIRISDVVVSTAVHEFFGVAVLEATMCGAFPIVPNRLVYPELYPKECLYNTVPQLKKMLKNFVIRPEKPRKARAEMRMDFEKLPISNKDFLSNFDF